MQSLVWSKILALVPEAGNSSREHYGDKIEPTKRYFAQCRWAVPET